MEEEEGVFGDGPAHHVEEVEEGGVPAMEEEDEFRRPPDEILKSHITFRE